MLCAGWLTGLECVIFRGYRCCTAQQLPTASLSPALSFDHCPCNFGAAGTYSSSEERTLEHTLSMHLQPNSSRLHSAELVPSSVDITGEVEYAKQRGGSLQLLVNAVRGKLRAHFKSASA